MDMTETSLWIDREFTLDTFMLPNGDLLSIVFYCNREFKFGLRVTSGDETRDYKYFEKYHEAKAYYTWTTRINSILAGKGLWE